MIPNLARLLGLKPRQPNSPTFSELRETDAYHGKLFERIRQAEQTQRANDAGEEPLRDPIEDSLATGWRIRMALARATKETGRQPCLGQCHQIWWRTQEILWEEHGILWFSPSQMNPDALFD